MHPAVAPAPSVAPHDLVLWQDIACVQYDYAVTIFNTDLAGATALESVVEDMEAAKDYVETALRLFRWILERKQVSRAQTATRHSPKPQVSASGTIQIER